MAKRKCAWIMILSIWLIGALTGCARHRDEAFHAGFPVTPDELDALSEELFTTESESASTADDPPLSDPDETSAPIVPDGSVVYWTPNGKVYHLYRDCAHLKKSESVESGSEEEALADGKERPCASCEDRRTKAEAGSGA